MKAIETFKKQFDFEINNNLLVKPFSWASFSELAYLEHHFLSNKVSLGFDDGQPYYEFIEEITFEEAFNLAKDLFDNNLFSNMQFGVEELDEVEVGDFESYFEK
jgi:hypothetical protein